MKRNIMWVITVFIMVCMLFSSCSEEKDTGNSEGKDTGGTANKATQSVLGDTDETTESTESTTTIETEVEITTDEIETITGETGVFLGTIDNGRAHFSNEDNDVIYPIYIGGLVLDSDSDPNEEFFDDSYGKSIINYRGVLDKNFNKLSDRDFHVFGAIYKDNVPIAYNIDNDLYDVKGQRVLEKVGLFEDIVGDYVYLRSGSGRSPLYNLLNTKTGKVVFEKQYSWIRPLPNGVFVLFENEDTFSYADKDGKTISKFPNGVVGIEDCDNEKYYKAYDKNGKWGIIDGEYNWLVSPQYLQIPMNDNALFYAETKDGKYVYFDMENSIFDFGLGDEYGIEKFYRNGKSLYCIHNMTTQEYGIMNANKEYLIPMGKGEINYNSSKSEISVRNGNKLDIYDENVKFVKSLTFNKYDYMGYGDNFILCRNYDSPWYIYNTSGKLIFSNSKDCLLTDDRKYVWVADKENMGYIDTSGKWCYKEKSTYN